MPFTSLDHFLAIVTYKVEHGQRSVMTVEGQYGARREVCTGLTHYNGSCNTKEMSDSIRRG